MSLLPTIQDSAWSADGLRFMIFPAVLFVYYLVCWLFVGKDPKIKNVTPQYEPPHGISPGVARYVLTGGSDGTTLAAVLAALAAQKVISIQPQGRSFLITLLNNQVRVMPEEAAVVNSILGVELPVQVYAATHTGTIGSPSVPGQAQAARIGDVVMALQDRKPSAPAFGDDVLESSMGTGVSRSACPTARSETVLDPLEAPKIKSVLDATQATFRDNLKGIYFRWNFQYVLAGVVAMCVWALGTSFFLDTPQGSPVFLTFWLLMFTSIAGIVMGGVFMSKPTHPTGAQRVQQLLLPIIFFLLPGFLIYEFALPTAHGFVIALLISVALNSVFMVLMRAPTAEGRRVLEQLAGFREFLLRVEQDRLDRLNTPAQKAELMDRFLPYAIALGVREGWGDTMAAAFSNAVVER